MSDRPVVRRRRVVAIGVLAAAVGASGLALDRSLGPRPARAGTGGGAASGALFCPHGGSPGGAGWVVVANPGPRAVGLRVTTFSDAGVRGVQSFSVPPSHEVFRSVPAERSATTEVEYFGGWVGAAAVVSARGSHAMAAARCVGAARSRWFLPEVPTGAGQSSYAIVMNPFAEPAEFDVVLQSDQRTVAPGALGPYVLGGRSSVALPINHFLLAGPDEHSVTARIVPRTGRVIAGALVSSATTLSAEAGIPSPSGRSVVPAAGFNGTAEVVVMNGGTARADLSLVAVSRSGEQLVSGPNGVSISADSVARAPLPMPPPAAIVEATNGQPVAAVMTVSRARGDADIISGSPSGHGAWLVLPSRSPKGGKSFLVLVNAGQTVAAVTLSLFGPDGPVPGPASLSLPPGRRIIVALPSPGGTPVSVLARARGGAIVAGSASFLAAGGYAATQGVPIGKRA